MRPTMIPADISKILKEIHERPEQRGELYCKLKKSLAKLKATGADIPPEVASFERNLGAELMSEAHGR